MTKANDLASLLDANGDVVSSALDNVPSADLVNDTTPQLGGTLDTNTNDINFGTNVKSNYGTSAQLMMYHDGSNGWIKGNNTGNNSIAIQSGGTGSVMISGSSGQNIISQQGDAAYLHHAGFTKLITTATGVDVTGTVTADGLTVDGDAEVQGLRIDAVADVELEFGYANTTHSKIIGDVVQASPIAGQLKFQTSTGGTLYERMRLDTKGAMILGDTAEPSGAGGNGPQFFLKQGSSSNGIASVANGNDAYIRMLHNGTLGQISTTYGTSAGYTPLSFATSGSERLQITTDGNILGTKAFIIPNAGQTNSFYASGEGIGIYNQNAYSNCGAHIEIATNASDGWSSFYVNRIWASGGDQRAFDFRVNGSTVGLINTTSSGTTYTSTSDIRLKTDIQPITHATDKLMSMNAVTHKWKADPDADAVHGFIAQEMQDIMPEAVSGTADGDEMMSMDYGRITPVIVAALQDAHKKIAELETRIKELEIS